MSDFLVPFFTGLITAWLPAGVALFNQRRAHESNLELLRRQLDHERDLKKDERYIARIEEFYILIEEWLDDLTNCYAPTLDETIGTLSFLTHNEKGEIFFDKAQSSIKRLNMLIDFYFPEAREAFNLCLKQREELIKIRNEYIKVEVAGNPCGEIYIPKLEKAIAMLQKRGEEVNQIIINLRKNKTSA